MSLDALFTDRKSRKYIIDSVNNASDVGKGVCSCCGEEAHLLDVFGGTVCEKCCESAVGIAENYDIVLESISDSEILGKIGISEGYVIPDMVKLQNDADAKFNGSIKDLLLSYKLDLHKDWDDRLDKGRVFIKPKDIEGGKSRVNQFLIDYNCDLMSASAAQKLVPDADGTLAPLLVKGQIIQAGATHVPNSPKTPTVKSANSNTKIGTSNVQKQSSLSSISPGYITGNSTDYTFQVGGKAEIKVTAYENNGSYSCDLYFEPDGSQHNLALSKEEYEDIKKSHEKIIKLIALNPGIMFSSFDMGNSEISITKYDIYKFGVDEKSFGSTFTMVPIYQGKKYSNTRIPMSDKALSSRVVMNAELTAYMDEKVRKDYPMLFDGHNKFKSSIGTAVFTLDSKENDIAVLSVDLANKKFKGRVDGKRLTDAKEARDAFAEIIMNALADGLIPGFKDQSITRKDGSYSISTKKGTRYASQGYGIDIFAEFDYNALYDNGDIAFNMSITDEFSGEEQPKRPRKFVYRKVGVSLPDYLYQCAMQIHDEFFTDSNMEGQMKDTAAEKMRSPSKKASLLRRISDELQKHLKSVQNIKDIDRCEIDLDMKVNYSGKVTQATFTVSDPFEDVTDDSRKLKDVLNLDGKVKWIKFSKLDKTMKDGPTVYYEVSDIQAFSDAVKLHIYESMIMEAYAIQMEVDSSYDRKVVHIF